MVDEKSALQIQNLLICIEMLIASLLHFYIFPYHEWQDGYKREKETGIGILICIYMCICKSTCIHMGMTIYIHISMYICFYRYM
jgi:hypothetical protein